MNILRFSLIVTLFLASCATPESFTATPMKPAGKNASYAVDEHPDGFTVSLNYSRYQFVPESSAVATAGRSALLSQAHEIADQRGRQLQPINEQRIKESMGRNGVSGITSWSGSVRVFYR